MLKKLMYTLGILLLVALFFAGNYLSGALSAASGFSAKNICSGHFLSGMQGQVIVDEALVSSSPVLSNISFDIDTINRQVDTRLFGFFKRRAVYSDGTGCTLLSAGQQQLNRNVEPTARSQPDHTLPWPRGMAPAPRHSLLEPILEQAFTEPDAQHKRNTKAVVVIHEGRLLAEKYAHGIEADTPRWNLLNPSPALVKGTAGSSTKLVRF